MDDLNTHVWDTLILEAANTYSTPFYLYSLDIIAQNIKELKEVLGSGCHLYYSVKANPNIDILKFIRSLGLGVEISSLGELQLVQMAGFSSNEIICSGPGKSDYLLDKLVSSQIRCINLESLSEIEHIQRLSKKYGNIVNVSFRLNPEKNSARTGMKMTGTSSQFGIDWSDIPRAVALVQDSPYIKLLGIQVYYGTQLLNASDIIENIDQIITFAKVIQNDFGIPIELIDFGGGFGLPYFTDQKELDLINLKDGILKIFRRNKDLLQKTYCIFESGRYLVGDSGVYVTSVIDRKKSHNRTYLICDGGSNHHANSAFLGRMITGNFPIRIIHRNETSQLRESEKVIITGPLCTPTDIIGRDIDTDICQKDDLIVIEKSGAYGLTYSPILFISHSLPKEIIIQNASFFESYGVIDVVKVVTNGI